MKIFVINLPSQRQRRENIAKQLNFLGLKFEFINAIYGKDLSCEEKQNALDASRADEFKRALSDGEIGCFLSHRLALESFLQSECEDCVILEDDAVIDERLLEFLSLIPRLPKECELVLLGHYRQVYLDDGFRIESPFSLRFDYELNEIYHLKRLVGGGFGSHGYFITRAGAGRLLAATERFLKPFDHYTSDESVVNVFALYPVAVEFELNSHSSVQENRKTKRRSKIAKYFKRFRKWLMFFPKSLKKLREYEVRK